MTHNERVTAFLAARNLTMSERHPLPTVYGTDSMEIAFTEANHAYATYTRDGVQRINQVEYRGSAHLFIWSDGRFHIGRETESSFERRSHLWLSRAAWTNYNKSHASESARAKFASVVELAVNDFFQSNKAIAHAAELEHLQNKLDAASDAYDKAIEVADAKLSERIAAAQALNAFLQEVKS